MTPLSLQMCNSWFMHEKEKIAIFSVSFSPNEARIQRHLPFSLSDNRLSHVFSNNCLDFLIQFGWESPGSPQVFLFFPRLPSGHKERTEIIQSQLCCRFLKWRANSWWQPRKQERLLVTMELETTPENLVSTWIFKWPGTVVRDFAVKASKYKICLENLKHRWPLACWLDLSFDDFLCGYSNSGPDNFLSLS